MKSKILESQAGGGEEAMEMVKNNLVTLFRAAKGLYNALDNNQDLDEWAKEKIAVSKSMLTAVWDYVESQNREHSGAKGNLKEFAPGGGGDDDYSDPYGSPKPEHYAHSIDFFGQFEADHFDDEEMNDATGVFKGYWFDRSAPNGRIQIAYFKFDKPFKTGSDDPGMGWYYEPQNEGVAEGSRKAWLKNNNLVDLDPAINNLTGKFDDLLRTHDPEERAKHQAGVKQRIRNKPMNGPKGPLPESDVAEGDYPDGSSIQLPSVEEWKQKYREAQMAVRNSKTQQEYEYASDRADRIKDLLASKGIQVGPVLGQLDVSESDINEISRGDYHDKAQKSKIKAMAKTMFADPKDPEVQKAQRTVKNRDAGIARASKRSRDEISARQAQQRQQSDTADRENLPALIQKFHEMLTRFKQLGGTSYQYADRMTSSDYEAQSLHRQLNDLKQKINKAGGPKAMAEGWKSKLAGAAMVGLGALGAGGHAHAADLSSLNTDYLQQVASGEHPRPMVSVDDAKAELKARADGKQQSVSQQPSNHSSNGFSKEYLQKASDPNRVGRYLISVERAQELLDKMQEGMNEWKKNHKAPIKPRNFVAKNATTSGAGAHKDKKKETKQGKVKHKHKDPEMAETRYMNSLNQILEVIETYNKRWDSKRQIWK